MPALPIPASAEELTPQWLTAALRSGGVLAGDATVEAVKYEPIGEGRAFAALPVRVRVHYAGDAVDAPRSLVAKFPAADPRMRAALSGLRWYESEIRFYEELAPLSPLRTPRCYFSAMDPEAQAYVLLLEELTGRLGDQVAGGTLADAECVVDAIAGLHGRWWDDTLLAKLDWLAVGAVRRVERAEMWQQYYRRTWAAMREPLADVLPGGVEGVAERLGEAYAALVQASAEPPRTLLHGDCRLDNVFFNDERAEPPSVIDFQFVSFGRGAYDLAYFLGTNLDPMLRRAHEGELLRRYHAALGEHAEGYGFDRCLRDYRLSMLLVFGFWMQTAGSPTLPPEAFSLRDVALSRSARALLDLDAGEALIEFGA